MRASASGVRMWVGAMALVALLAGACTAGDTESTGDTTASTGAPDTDPSGGGENTASFRGVTADTIKVGVVVPDFSALQRAGIPTYYGDYEPAYQAFFDVINEAGGIHGRKIEAFYADFDYLRKETQDAACTELTEDHEVFVVLGGLLSANNLCFTELHHTMLMTGIFQTEELRERSGDTLWLSLAPVEEAIIETLGTAVAESGELEGKTIGIVALGAVANGDPGYELQKVLDGLGYESTVAVVSAPTTDEVAIDQEIGTIAQRFMTDGIDFVFSVTEGPGVYEPFEAAGYHPTIVDRSLGSSVVASPDTAILDGVLGIGGRPGAEVWKDPKFKKNCSDVVLAAHPELQDEFDRQVPGPEQQAKGLPNWLITISGACNHTMLLKQLGEIAGADLTNDTFRAALDELGPIELYSAGKASFRSADKWDGQDEFYLQRWNEAEDRLELIGDPIVLER